ncbi:MAG: ABC transporter ATP-binding protein [Methylocystis sp.]
MNQTPVPRISPSPLLEVCGVVKSYATPQGRLQILKGVDISLAPGETLALMGESGSGKSTVLNLAAGLDAPEEGEIRLCGQSLGALSEAERARLRRETVGLVFQRFNLIASLTVAQNLSFQARLCGRLDPAWQAELTARLGLTGLEGRYPEALSGGQQQRVAIGRALAARPRLILADEPTGNLDEASGDEALSLMLDLVAASGAGLLIVTHSARLAARLGRQARLEHGVMASSVLASP